MNRHCHLQRLWAALFLSMTTLSLSAQGEPITRDAIPAPLLPYVDWVLHDYKTLNCPVVGEETSCLWPGVLLLILDASGGRFEMRLQTDREMPVPLPGESDRWPEAVTLNGKATPVFGSAGTPAIVAPEGTHVIRGQFIWQQLPEGLQVPPIVARIALDVSGTALPTPKRDPSGRVWLSGAVEKEDTDTMDLSVMRRITDAVPLRVDTRIVVRAAGKAREVVLPNVLLAGTVPLSVSAPIPSRVDKEGNLTLQLRPGTHDITIEARTAGSPSRLAMSKQPAPWPEAEVWVWQADESLRQVTLSGLSGIDPSRTDLIEAWRTLPAYLATPDAALTLTTSRRGEATPPPDSVHLERQMWLDLDGEGFTIQDKLSGDLNRSTRVDLALPGELARATVGGRDELITAASTSGTGVEIRTSPFSMVAEWRLAQTDAALPAVGWQRDVQSLSTTLHLPPGWRLLTTKGVDTVTNTWWSQWDLFSFFFVLIVAIAVGKLTKWYVGGVALLALVLAQHEADAPFVVWGFLLVSLALLKVIHKGKLRIAVTVIWWASIVWLAAVLIPFSVQQMREGLFPQVAGLDYFDYDNVAGYLPQGEMKVTRRPAMPASSSGKDEAPPAPPMKQRADSADIAEVQQALEQAAQNNIGDLDDMQNRKGGYGRKRKSKLTPEWLAQDPKAVVQTGVGVPSWTWQSWHLGWTGPVAKDHTLTLYLLSPGMNLVIAILRVLLLVFVGLRLALEGRKSGGGSVTATGTKGAAAAAAALLLVPAPTDAAAQNMSAAAADMPSATMLETLADRMREALEG